MPAHYGIYQTPKRGGVTKPLRSPRIKAAQRATAWISSCSRRRHADPRCKAARFWTIFLSPARIQEASMPLAYPPSPQCSTNRAASA